MHEIPEDFLLSSYNYALPEELIAQHPPETRGASRLLVLDRASEEVEHSLFADLARHLPPDALLVANSSRVTPVRLTGKRATGGRLECLLLTPLPLVLEQAQSLGAGRFAAQLEVLLRGSKKSPPGSLLSFGPLSLDILERGPFGHCTARLEWQGDLEACLSSQGHMPLPPYIRRPDRPQDAERYQTVYAATPGSAAAPTAGLHFTHELIDGLKARGFGWAQLTLHVGYGTFSPVRCPDIRKHRMHAEYVTLNEESAQAVRQAKAEGRAVVAVGTTVARALEGCQAACGEIRPFCGWTDIFLYPGAHFAVLDGLITNFHLPKSSLLMLLCAFAKRKTILSAYTQAVKSAYHFFSYGDAMLIK